MRKTLKCVPTALAAAGLLSIAAIVPNGLNAHAAGTPTNAEVPSLASGACGTITSYTPASAAATGQLVLNVTSSTDQKIATGGSTTYTIGANPSIAGQGALYQGNDVCIFATTPNSSGQVSSLTVLPDQSIQIEACGTTTQSSADVLSIADTTFALANSVAVTGGPAAVGQLQDAMLTLSPLGTVTAISFATTPTCTADAPALHGPFTTVSAPTATTGGTFTVGPHTFNILPAANLTINRSVPLAAITVSGGASLGATGGMRAE